MKLCLKAALEASALARGWGFNLTATESVEQQYMEELGLLISVTLNVQRSLLCMCRGRGTIGFLPCGSQDSSEVSRTEVTQNDSGPRQLLILKEATILSAMCSEATETKL